MSEESRLNFLSIIHKVLGKKILLRIHPVCHCITSFVLDCIYFLFTSKQRGIWALCCAKFFVVYLMRKTSTTWKTRYFLCNKYFLKKFARNWKTEVNSTLFYFIGYVARNSLLYRDGVLWETSETTYLHKMFRNIMLPNGFARTSRLKYIVALLKRT